MLLSLIICTRNRSDELEICLPGVALQARQFHDVEVVVVDNGSTDGTRELVARLGEEQSFDFRYVYEATPGLCTARNSGKAAARGRVLAYIDDDVRLGADWVRRVREHFLSSQSDCLGGKVTAELAGELPFPMDEMMLWFFQATTFGEIPRKLVYPEHPTGCNMAFTMDVFDRLGGFDTKLKLYGDETDFFRRASEAGFSVWYDPAIIVNQMIPAERLTLEEIKAKSYKWGQGAATLWLKDPERRSGRFVKAAEYALRSGYVWQRTVFNPTFGRYYTYWYNRGYLSKLFEGLEN